MSESIPFPAPSSRSSFRAVLELSPKDRDNLTSWRRQVQSILDRCEESEGLESVQLREHAESNVRGVWQAIRDACAPLRGAMLDEATEAVRPYFPRIGDAREAARFFPEVIQFRNCTHGPALATDLKGLRRQAGFAQAMLAALLEGEDFWQIMKKKAEGAPE